METNREVVEAVHQLEIRLNQSLNSNTIALEVNNERLANLKEAVDKHTTILYGHEENDRPGLITRIAKIEQADSERKWTLRSVTVAFLGLCVKSVYDWISHV